MPRFPRFIGGAYENATIAKSTPNSAARVFPPALQGLPVFLKWRDGTSALSGSALQRGVLCLPPPHFTNRPYFGSLIVTRHGWLCARLPAESDCSPVVNRTGLHALLDLGACAHVAAIATYSPALLV